MKGPSGGGWTEPGGVSDSRGFQPVGNPLILGVSQAEIQKMQPQWRSLRSAPLSNGIVHFLGVSCWSCLAGEPKHKTTRPRCPVPRHNNSLLQESQSLSYTSEISNAGSRILPGPGSGGNHSFLYTRKSNLFLF